MKKRLVYFSVTVFLAALTCSIPDGEVAAQQPVNAPTVDFRRDVEPILARNCATCHQGAAAPANLRLDSPDGIRAGGASGPAIVPGNADGSLIVQRLTDGTRPMPPTGPLPAEQIAVIRNWIAQGAVAQGGASVDFQREVRPILSENCFACHGPDDQNRKANLRWDIPTGGAFTARPTGTPIVPGKPDESLMYQKITATAPARQMPPPSANKTLTAQQKDVLRRWIESGAQWKEHWAFVVPQQPPLPAVKNASWLRNPIDRFVLAKLEEAGLSPAPEADRRTWARRASLDVIGLPPSPADVDAFVKDSSPNAYEKFVDRLLASPHYGEHRAHYWLDVARYADTHGLSYDNYRDMWPYRDWVIQAFNKNLPYNQFVIEQLAGDLLPQPTFEQRIATGFNRNSPTSNENGLIEEEVRAIYDKDRADTTGIVFLGLTVGCATCHDHKFDPIRQRDYYAFQAFFRNTVEKVMDRNRPDTPPFLFVPRKADRARYEALTARHLALRTQIADMRMAAHPAFDKWLQSGARDLTRALQNAEEIVAVGAADVASAPGATLVDAPWGSRQALQFDGKKAVERPNVPYFTGDEPFSISVWVNPSKHRYHPGTSGSRNAPTIASQLGPDQGAAPVQAGAGGGGRGRMRGWRIDLDQGVPELQLVGDRGLTMRALVVQTNPVPEGRWTHLTFTYDGSRKEQGVAVYVNGERAPLETGGAYTAQEAETRVALEGTLKTSAPLVIGAAGSGAAAFAHFEGAIADLRVVNRAVTAEESQVLAAWPTAASALRANTATLSPAQKDALRIHYLAHHDARYRTAAAELTKTEAELQAIRNAPMFDGRDSYLAGIGREIDDPLGPVPNADTRPEPVQHIEDVAATALVMHERMDSKATAKILIRGAYDSPGEEVEAATPAALPPMPANYPRNRLGLAMWITDKTNPLTARVAVNRFWQEVFGAGIVRTAEDFGAQGEHPSHPELLDWLAIHFRDSGWDAKALMKLMLTSATYRQSAQVTPEKLAKDPENRLLARAPRFRMDGEMVRDYALAVSGLLRPTIGGPPVRPYQPPGVWEAVAIPRSNTRFYRQDHGDALYRRSVYTLWKRSAPPASLEIFGAPTRESTTVRRERSSSPLQSLVTMNDTQFVEAARHLAQRAMQQRPDLQAQVDFMSAHVLLRPLATGERNVLTTSYQNFLKHYTGQPDEARKLLAVGESPVDAKLPPAALAALTMTASQLLNLDETLNK